MGERRLRSAVAGAIAIALLSAGAGYALRVFLEPDAPVSPRSSASVSASAESPAAADPRDAEVASLRQQLAAELEDRARLEEKFRLLRDEALELAAVYRDEEPQVAGSGSASDAPASAEGRPATDPELKIPAHQLPGAKPQKKGVSIAALQVAGFGEVESQSIRERIESIAMRQLYLSNTAEREGWKGTTRFTKAYRQIGLEFDEMREEYGEDRFDWILYAAGRQNRVVVDSVLGESAASEVGLQPGDFITSYADQRVFNGSELRQATLQGEAGELVLLEYERKGVPQRVYVPRGPVGVQLHTATLPPGRS